MVIHTEKQLNVVCIRHRIEDNDTSWLCLFHTTDYQEAQFLLKSCLSSNAYWDDEHYVWHDSEKDVDLQIDSYFEDELDLTTTLELFSLTNPMLKELVEC